jgi:hypothetical protein
MWRSPAAAVYTNRLTLTLAFIRMCPSSADGEPNE